MPRSCASPIVCCGVCAHVAYHDAFNELGVLGHPDIRCTVTLVEAGQQQVSVMAAVRKATSVSLHSAKDLVDSVPAVLLDQARVDEAEELTDELSKLGAMYTVVEREDDPAPAGWREAPRCGDPDETSAIVDMLTDRSLVSSAEKELRLFLYWLNNHPYRYDQNPWLSTDMRGPAERENVERLLRLMDEVGADQLCKANIAREASQFATAIALLENRTGVDSEAAWLEIQRLARDSDSRLRVLHVST